MSRYATKPGASTVLPIADRKETPEIFRGNAALYGSQRYGRRTIKRV